MSFCKEKVNVNKMKRQPVQWEKIFANNVTNKSLVSKTYKKPIQLDNNKIQSKNGWKT